jgi:uncharacterized protein with PQ loop repeat
MKKSTIQFIKGPFLEHFTIFMGVIGQCAPYIQAYYIFYLQSSYAVSMGASLMALFSMACWLIYGLSRNVKPLIISNFFGMIGMTLVIVGILYYR